MRTIIISTSNFGNAVSNYYRELGNEFVKNGFKVVYIFDGLITDLPEHTDHLYYYSWPSKRPTKFSDFIFLSKLIIKYKPVLCISNFGSAIVMSITSYLLRIKNRIEYIHTTTRQREIDSHNSLKIKFYRLRKKLVYKLNTHFFTNSEGTKIDSINKFGIKKDKIFVLPLLIKPSSILYHKKDERENAILIVGRLNPSKGHESLLQQFSNCLKEFPTLKLKIIGTGFLRPKLEQICKSLKISDKVIFLGNIPNEKIGNEFSKVLVNVSASFEEAFGLVNIEALREGTPLICTKTAGSRDILIENYNGVYYDNSLENSLQNALIRVLPDWETYSKNAKATFNKNYCFNKNITDQFNTINQLIGQQLK